MEKIVFMKNGNSFVVNKEELASIDKAINEGKAVGSGVFLTIRNEKGEVIKIIGLTEISHVI